MTSYFGFAPSAQLKNVIEATRKAVDSGAKDLYQHRDNVALGVNDELIDHTMIALVNELPANEKKEKLLNAANTIKKESTALLTSLMGKDGNDVVMKSINFFNESEHTNAQGEMRVGLVLPDSLASQMKASFAAVAAGDYKNQQNALKDQFKMLADVSIKHYMEDFNKTLDMGMLKKAKAATVKGIIGTVLSVLIGWMIPRLSEEELKVFCAHYDTLIYTV